jgi:hypothetical protein
MWKHRIQFYAVVSGLPLFCRKQQVTKGKFFIYILKVIFSKVVASKEKIIKFFNLVAVQAQGITPFRLIVPLIYLVVYIITLFSRGSATSNHNCWTHKYSTHNYSMRKLFKHGSYLGKCGLNAAAAAAFGAPTCSIIDDNTFKWKGLQQYVSLKSSWF